MSNHSHQPDGAHKPEALPAALAELDQRLARDGARWRDTLPPSEPLARRVAGLLASAPVPPRPQQPSDMAETRDGAPADRRSGARLQPNQANREAQMHRGQGRGWLAAVAAVLVVGLMAVVLYTLGPIRPAAHTTRRVIVTATTTPAGHWETAAHLTHEGSAPILAPSDPQVVYEMPAPSDNGVAHGMQRSDDGGATWQPLPLPQLDGPLLGGNIVVSPVDAHNAFLQVEFGVLPVGNIGNTYTCPPAPASGSAYVGGNRVASNYQGCPALFFSTDGGDHWARATLPFPTQMVFSNQSWPPTGQNVLQAQGDRLYAVVYPDPLGGDTMGQRLLVSGDHGATWQVADTALFNQAPAICDAVATSQGTTLFALTADTTCFGSPDGNTLTLWRSDDDGATWTSLGAQPLYFTQLYAVAGGNGAQPVLYGLTHVQGGDATLRDVHVSVDDGRTWTTAPSAGVPASMLFDQLAGFAADGSVVAAMVPSALPPATAAAGTTPTPMQPRIAYTVTLYSWHAADAAWRPISTPSRIIGQPGIMLIVPASATAAQSIWIVSLSGDFFSANQSYDVDVYVLG